VNRAPVCAVVNDVALATFRPTIEEWSDHGCDP